MALEPGRFVVADDEREDLRVYNTGRFGGFEDVEISDLKGLDDTADLEGGTRIGDVFYWITSHSAGRRGSRPMPLSTSSCLREERSRRVVFIRCSAKRSPHELPDGERRNLLGA